MTNSLILLDYETLRIIWWLLMGVLLIGFAIMDGFDLGVAALLPVIGRSDTERRLMINLVGPVWEGNQVWLITAGGAIFAAWPALYATSFSSFYLAMMLLLVTLILRPVGFKYRSKYEGTTWRNVFDGILTFAGVVAPVVFGVAFGNVILGIPFEVETPSMRPLFHGTFFGLFTPFTLFCGVLSLLMLVTHGATLIAWRVVEPVNHRARKLGIITALLVAVLFAAGGFWLSALDGQLITSAIDPSAPSNPLNKSVDVVNGAWLANFAKYPWMWAAPALGVVAALLTGVCLAMQRPIAAFISSSLSIAGVILSVGFALFPFILPSSANPNQGLTVWDASSSHLTLWVMLIVTIIFLPIVLSYTSYVYRVMRGPITEETLNETHNSY
ncbi:cytochrome d ubiquinol oxidase subunit II [Oligella urethralis]|uniref:Cytochrome d ubiquinol oxidase subunit 2 n=1 Tax=Oligella urethralis DNF00040 TaxID=1401065 RepID=A0A096ALV6_9BURK|nr:cytochrome d ubiquinol oxidase subunit II [Oligella urethralis]KGF31642.1 cytochrome d ubiquinol oxidase subunit 2 [Oligella urethralis DNF00040]